MISRRLIKVKTNNLKYISLFIIRMAGILIGKDNQTFIISSIYQKQTALTICKINIINQTILFLLLLSIQMLIQKGQTP